jgi:hypothetical protein
VPKAIDQIPQTSLTTASGLSSRPELNDERAWVEFTDRCQSCGSVFDMRAPAHVVERIYWVWVEHHQCQ